MHIVLTSALIATIGLILLRFPRYRRQMLWGGVCSIGFVVIELYAVGSLRSFGTSTANAALSFALMSVEAMSTGAIAVVLFEVAINQRLSPSVHRDRHRLFLLAVGAAVTTILVAIGTPFMISLVIGLATNAALLVIIGHHLASDAFIGAVGFGALYVITDVAFGIRNAGSIDRFLMGASPLGPSMFGIPIERIFAVAGSGALIGPIFAALKKRRLPHHPVSTVVPRPRMILGVSIAMCAAVVASWGATVFVLPPTIETVSPDSGSISVPTAITVTARFSRPVDRDSLTLTLDPPVNGSWQFDGSVLGRRGYRSAQYVFDETLIPGVTYRGIISGIRSTFGVASSNVPVLFTTIAAPDVLSVTGTPAPGAPEGDQRAPIEPCDPIVISLTGENDGSSEFSFVFEPPVEFKPLLDDDRTSYRLYGLPCFSEGTVYRIRVDRKNVTHDPASGEVISENEPETVLETILSTASADGTAAALPDRLVLGTSIGGGGALTVVRRQKILPIALDYQDQPLSCEAAALKMALAGRGVRTTERKIMNVVGYDPTPHRGKVWGDPDKAFVGNIAGRQNSTGYGVHWKPIERAADRWRDGTSFTNWSPSQLAEAIEAEHPVVIWGTQGKAVPDRWKTPSGKIVSAWKGEHARTVIGYIGTVERPTRFVINDPIAGRLTWTTATLLANWSRYNYSGVVVE